MQSISRREFLNRAATSASAAAAGCLSLSANSARGDAAADSPPVIDVHIHTNFAGRVLQNQAARISGVNFSPEGLVAELKANGIVQAVSIGFETQEGELSRAAENPMGTAPAEAYPESLSHVHFVGGINPHRLDAGGLARIDRALAGGSLKGLKIYLGYYHRHPDDDVYRRVYELAARHQVPVILHTGDTYSANAKVRYAHPLRIDDVAVDFREVTFVLAHLGNPWTIDAAELMYKNRNVYGDLSGFLVGDAAYFAAAENAEGIEHAVERIRRAFAWVENPKKFLYGSDWPLVPMQPYLALMRRAIDAEHHERVFYANAREVFQLPE